VSGGGLCTTSTTITTTTTFTTTTSTTIPCRDTDGGRNNQVAGVCYDSGTCVRGCQDACNFASCGLYGVEEYSCNPLTNLCQKEVLACPSGSSCDGGACRMTTTTTSTTTTTLPCVDSDVTPAYPSGINPTLRGTVRNWFGTIVTDQCTYNNNAVEERFCNPQSPSGADTVVISCPSLVCQDGACITTTTTTSTTTTTRPTTTTTVPPVCTDTDNGLNRAIRGAACMGTPQNVDECLRSGSNSLCDPSCHFDTCSSDDTISEGYCYKGHVESVELSCPGGQVCSDGACHNP
jgi:hypothetical protein